MYEMIKIKAELSVLESLDIEYQMMFVTLKSNLRGWK